jgi:hypothetical protein
MFHKNVALTQDGPTVLQNHKCHSNEYWINYIKCLIAEIDTIQWQSSVQCPPYSIFLLQHSTRASVPLQKETFSYCARHSYIAFSTSSPDQKWHPCIASFKGLKKWKSHGAKFGEYGGWSNASNFKYWICSTVLQAAWFRALSCCRHSLEDNKSWHFVWIAALSSHEAYHYTFHCSET